MQITVGIFQSTNWWYCNREDIGMATKRKFQEGNWYFSDSSKKTTPLGSSDNRVYQLNTEMQWKILSD